MMKSVRVATDNTSMRTEMRLLGSALLALFAILPETGASGHMPCHGPGKINLLKNVGALHEFLVDSEKLILVKFFVPWYPLLLCSRVSHANTSFLKVRVLQGACD